MWSTLFPAKIVKLNPPKKALKRAPSTRLIKKQRFFSPAHLRFFLQMLLPNMRPVRITKRYAKPSTRTQQWKHAIATTVLIMACGSYGSAYGLGANATDSTRYTFDIPSLKVEEALSQLAKQTGHQLLFSYALVNSHNSTAVKGEHSLTSALQQLLQNTPLTGNLTERGVILVTDTRALHNLEKGRGNMNITTKKSLLATFVAVFGAGAVSSGVVAQDGNDAATGQTQLDEIIVTAQKREQNLKDVPISITAIGSEELALRGITNIRDLGLAVPGLAVQHAGADQRRYFLRGVGNFAGSSSPVGVYFDEISLTGGNPESQIDVQSYDLERVEVLRGPQGTLYGQGSLGGTIRFVSKNPELDQFGAKLGIGAYSTEDGDPSYNLEGMINVPLIEDELGLRISGTFNRDGGWIDQPLDGKENINDQRLANIRIKTLWQPTDALQIKAMAVVHRNNGAVNRADENNNYTQTFNHVTSPSIQDDYELYNLTVTYDFDAIRLLSSSSLIDVEKIVDDRGTFTARAAPLPPSQLEFFDSSSDHTAKSQELRLSSIGGSSWNWSFGGYYESGESPRNTNAVLGDPAAPRVINDIFRQPEYKQWAVFGDTSFALTERLEVGAGLRYFEDDRTFTSQTNGGVITVQSDTFDAVSPKIYMNYDVTDDIKAYLSVGEGFRSGGFNSFGRPAYDPEELLSYEVGAKMSFLDGRLKADIAYYDSDYEGYQITGIDPVVGLNVLSNAGDAKIKGIDLNVVWYPLDRLSLGASGNYNDGAFTKITTVPGTSHYDAGDRVPLIPRYQFGLWANVDVSLIGKPGSLRLDYSQVGESIVRLGRADHQIQLSDVIKVLNLRTHYEFSEDVSIGLFFENILNENGNTVAFDATPARSRPRNFGIDIDVTF